jgi:hypothetical protein
MPFSLSDSADGKAPPIDKSKFWLFKPLSLDVIFHGCEIGGDIRDIFDAFAR